MLHHVEGGNDANAGIGQALQVANGISFVRFQVQLFARLEHAFVQVHAGGIKALAVQQFQPFASPTAQVHHIRLSDEFFERMYKRQINHQT